MVKSVTTLPRTVSPEFFPLCREPRFRRRAYCPTNLNALLSLHTHNIGQAIPWSAAEGESITLFIGAFARLGLARYIHIAVQHEGRC
jgi:hypothetical protein